MKLFLRIATLAIIAALIWAAVRFILANDASIEIDYLLSSSVDLLLWQGLVFAFALGWVAATAVFGVGWLRARIETRRYRKAHAKIEAEVHQLRSLPIGDTPAPVVASKAEGD